MDTDIAKQRKEIRTWHGKFVLISCCLTMVLHIGFLYSIGTIFTDVMATFNTTRAETAAIQSTSIGMCLCSGLFTGALINKIGLVMAGILGALVVSLSFIACFFATSLTFLIIAIGAFSGIGFSCVYITSAAALSQHFSGRKQLLYLSIQASGAGIGGMIYPFVIRYLSDLYGFRGALLIIGAIVMHTVPCSILWKQPLHTYKRQEREDFTDKIFEFQTRFQVITEDSGVNITIEKDKQTSSADVSDSVYVGQYPVLPGETKTKTVIVQSCTAESSSWNKNNVDQTFWTNIRKLMRNKSFMLFVFGTMISIPALHLIIIFVADIYRDNGLTNNDVSLGLFLINVMGTFGRLLPGIVLQSKRISTLVLPLFNGVVSAVLVFSFTFAESRWLIIVLSGAIGIPLGVGVSLVTVITLKLVGSKILPIAIGMFFTLDGIGQLTAGPVNGYIRDVTGSYFAIFYITAGVNVVAAVFFLLAYITRRRDKHELRKRSSSFYLTNF